MMNLNTWIKPIRNSNAIAAGTGTTNLTGIDMAGFAGIAFLVGLGTVTSTGTGVFKLQESDDNSSFSDLTGTSQSWVDTSDDKCLYIEVVKPLKRYIRGVLIRSTANSVIDFVLAIPFSPQFGPPSLDATFISREIHNQPIAGTA